MKTRVSVIIPVYNIQEFLEDCVDSVLDQTINDLELTDGYERNLQIILVDDGSTDDSPIIAKKYAEKYENVEYVYEENQGLGHARNYGCEFAEGDYIIFLDSDDVVPPKAYERMYKAAVRDGSDFVTGSVWRFNSNGYWFGNIHEKAFNGKEEVTHISKSPQLIYDTTSWNKMIKRSFWEKNEFKFPEGILYEDIPVTIPMHYLANHVSIVYDNCYLWRIREGLSKSITQTTDENKNLRDRLCVLRSVDKFFKEHVTEPELEKARIKKWLSVDLMIFINKFKSQTEEEAKEVREELIKYIDESIGKENFDCLNEIEELKYNYLYGKDFEKLVELMHFEMEDIKSSIIYEKGGHLYVDIDPEIVEGGRICVDKFASESKKVKYLEKISVKQDMISVRGLTIIPGLKDNNFGDREYSFELVNCESRKRIPLNHRDVKIKEFSEYKIKLGNDLDYSACGYEVDIPYDDIAGDKDFYGENRIWITFKQHGITKHYLAGVSKRNVKASSDDKAMVSGNHHFCLKYDLDNSLILDIHPVRHMFDNLFVDGEKLCIESPEFVDDIVLRYQKDSINPERNEKVEYNSEKKRYELDIHKLSSKKSELLYKDGTPVLDSTKRYICLPSELGQCHINALRNYRYTIRMQENTCLANKIQAKYGIVRVIAELHSVEHKGKKIDEAHLCFKGKLDEELFPVAKGRIMSDNQMQFFVNLHSKKTVKNLYQGRHDIYIQCRIGDEIVKAKLNLRRQCSYTYKTKLYDYQIYRSNVSTLRIRSGRKWKKSLNSHAKRKHLEDKQYKFYMKLPVKKKTIVFESMWGTKYSCNPRYLYEYIDANHKDYKCVWFLKDEHFPIKGKGKRVRRLTPKYFYYLATAKYFVNNVNFNDHYIKRPKQVEIQTMHGTPLKTLGLDVPGDFPTIKHEEMFITKCKRWDYLTVQSDFVSDIARKCFLFDKEVLDCGYPRTDILYTKNNEKDIKEIKKNMGLPLDKKVILYAPTWRIKNKFDLMLDIESLRKALSDEYVLILRLHHFSVKGWDQPQEDDFVYDLSNYNSVEELYLISDILVTDYSSVMFDYGILDRPIILFTYDMEEYSEKLRGLYVDIKDDAPGPMCYSSKEVENAIVNLEQTEKENKPRRDKFRAKFLQYECENSSERVFETVMKKK